MISLKHTLYKNPPIFALKYGIVSLLNVTIYLSSTTEFIIRDIGMHINTFHKTKKNTSYVFFFYGSSETIL